MIARSLRRPAGRYVLVLLALVLLAALGTGCASSTGCGQTGTPVPVSQQAAQRLQAKLEQISGSTNPSFNLEITDEEATSYLALNMPQSPVKEAEVRFTEGKASLLAKVAQLFNLQVNTVWSARVDNGVVRVKLEAASVACNPVPTQLLDSLSATINQMIVESQTKVQISNIQIVQGKVIIAGKH
jgi:hypothetical protein